MADDGIDWVMLSDKQDKLCVLFQKILGGNGCCCEKAYDFLGFRCDDRATPEQHDLMDKLTGPHGYTIYCMMKARQNDCT